MSSNIQVSKRMEQATTSHGADTASNAMTRSVKSGVYVLLALVALVEGCSVGPRYKAPTPTIRPFHNPAPMRADGAPAPPLDTWWEGFGDRELTRIVQRALDQNLDLAASVTRVEQARAAAKEAGARLKPSGALNAQSTSFRQSLESPTGRVAEFNLVAGPRRSSSLRSTVIVNCANGHVYAVCMSIDLSTRINPPINLKAYLPRFG